MSLIKPKQIILKSRVDSDATEKTFSIGRYPALDAVEMIARVSAVLRDSAKGNPQTAIELAKSMKQLATDVCQYVEVELPNGDPLALNNPHMINAHITDGEMLLDLVRQVHDYNTFFLNSGNLLKTSRTLVDQAREQITGILSQLSASSSPKSKPRSKKSAKTTTTKTS